MQKKAWVLSVDMGYGHMRAAYPLKDIAYKRIIVANTDPIITYKEQQLWRRSQSFYESVSRFKDVPIIGSAIFKTYDRLQNIAPLFPIRDLSKPTYVVEYIRHMVTKKGLCSSLVEEISKTNYPVIATHFIPIMACHYAGLKNKLYCVVTDSDLNRVWIADKPAESKVTYLASCRHAVMRLREYGVPEKYIVQTGFPLPKENIGGVNGDIIKKDIGKRLINLDPKRIYLRKYDAHIQKVLGAKNIRTRKSHPLTITYLVGGAGAQSNTGIAIAKAMKERIKAGRFRLNLVAGTRKDVYIYFHKELDKLGLFNNVGKEINVIFDYVKNEYFEQLNYFLRGSDLIWTKPSEMSFYAGLGLPIILTPPIGSQEDYNKQWLEHMGNGFMGENPEYIEDWLFYWLESGRFAEAALEGYLEAPTYGTYNIEELVLNHKISDHMKQLFS